MVIPFFLIGIFKLNVSSRKGMSGNAVVVRGLITIENTISSAFAGKGIVL